MVNTETDIEGLDLSRPIGAQLYVALKGRIVRGELTPGVRLSEAGVAATYHVSRQPVRECFIKLAEEGLLEVRPQRGTVVPRISLQMVKDARFVREAIEADIVRLAAVQLDRGQVDALEDLLERQQRAELGRDFVELDDRFHRSLAEGVGKGHAWHVIEEQKAQLDRLRFLSLLQFPKPTIIAQHAAVVTALRANDADAAEAAMRLHLNEIMTDLPRIAADNSEFFDT